MEESCAIPKNIQELRNEWGRASLEHGLSVFGEDLPEYILGNRGSTMRAADELIRFFREPLRKLASVSARALGCYDQSGAGHGAALDSFHGSILIDDVAISDFFREPGARYLRNLIAGSVSDAEKFRLLLGLFVELGEQADR